MRSQSRLDVLRHAAKVGVFVALAICMLAFPLAAQPQQGNLPEQYEDESLIAPIRLAFRGGNNALAQRRLEELDKDRLKAMGTAALGQEYIRGGDEKGGLELIDKGLDIATRGDMRTFEKIQAILYISKIHADLGNQEQAEELIDDASSRISRLAGISFNLGVTELVRTVLAVTGDRQEAYDLLGILTDETLRDKLVKAYGLTDLAG